MLTRYLSNLDSHLYCLRSGSGGHTRVPYRLAGGGDEPVDWALGQMIRRGDRNTPLFNSYRLTNQYQEKRGNETTYVYDFEAECRVVLNPSSFDNYGRTYPAQWMQPTNPRSPGETRSFKGSVSLVKKGDQWYARKTLR